MPFQQKRLFASLANSVLVFTLFYWYVFNLYQQGGFVETDSMALLGKLILLLIGGGIILNILITIVFSIVIAIAQNEPEPSFVVDERDKLIELKGLRASIYVTGAGFILSVVGLALGQSVFIVFIGIVGSFGLGDVCGNLRMLRIYQKET